MDNSMENRARSFFGGVLRASASHVAAAVSEYASNVTNRASADATRILLQDPANTVQEITGRGSIDDVARYPVLKRDGTLILHGPVDSSGFSFTKPSRFNLILHHPTNSSKMFTLHRSDNQILATEAFETYKGVLSPLINTDCSLCEKCAIEKICTKLRDPENKGWTAAHIAAAFDYNKLFSHPNILKNINDQEGAYLRTPLQIALLHSNYQSVVELINLGAQLDVPDVLSNTILHHAVQSSSKILSFLIDKMPEHLTLLIDTVNSDGFTALHLACNSNNPEIVKILLRAGANVNIPSPRNGEYPIHSAVKSTSIVSIQELITLNPGQLNLTDVKEGGTPLHWAQGHETLNTLLELGCDPNIMNKNGEAALHFAARRGCLKSCLSLLCHHAFPDLVDRDGEAPLHIACRLCSRIIIQVLIVFGADIDLKNNNGQSGRHLISTSQRSDKDYILFYMDSVGAARCPESMKHSCTDGCIHSGTFQGIPPLNYSQNFNPTLVHEALYAFSSTRHVVSKSQQGSVEAGLNRLGVSVKENGMGAQIGGRLLCLDGGGIRGIVLTQILLFMEKEFGAPIVEMFDWISGTSTGGILALCIACGKSVLDSQALYLRLKNKVFIGERPYNSDTMDDFLKTELGADRKMSQILRPRVMITTSIVETRPADFHFFRNYLSPAKLMGESTDPCTKTPEEVFVWEAAKATGAAPSYFRLQGRYVDGGLVANNPTIDALTELTQFAAVMKAIGVTRSSDFKLPSVVVSLGTGIPPRVSADVTHFDLTRPSGIFDTLSKIPKLATLVQLLIEQTTQTDGQVVERAKAWCSSIGIPYFRFSPPLGTFVDLDETDDNILVNIMWETRAYLHAHKNSIVELKHVLYANAV